MGTHRHEPVNLPTPFAIRPRVRIAVLWLLAIVLPLQGSALAMFAAMGPAHMHVQAQPATPLVLEDFRRWRPAPVAQAHVFTSLGHFHASAAPQRHHHAFDDTSVVRTDDTGASNGADIDEALTASGSLAGVLALIPALAPWHAAKLSRAIEPGPLWTPQTGFTLRADRPPKRA